jgi:hypothetical protein
MTFDGENIGPEPQLDPNVTVTLENATSPGDVRLTAAPGGKCDLYVGTTLLLSLATPLDKTHVGLGNVDNTSDLAKPVSTATQTALNAKVARTGDTMSGALTLPGNPSAALEAAPKQYVDALQTTLQGRTLTAGAGLTGGGDLSANRTFTVGAGTGITVNADDVALTVPVTIANGGTGAATAAAAFDALKQFATVGTGTPNAGVLTMAPDAQIRAAAGGSYAVTAGSIESASAFVALTDAATVAVDWDTGINWSLTVTANRIIGNPTNGQIGTFRSILVQGNDATARTITFGNQFLGSVPTIIDCTSTKWYLLTIMCITTTHFVVTSVQAK